MSTSTLQAIKYAPGKLEVLDQLRLPHEFHYDAVTTREEAFDCILSMRVRGAPAIAIVAALSLAVELQNGRCTASTHEAAVEYVDTALDYLMGSRPTAVDLSNAIHRLKAAVRALPAPSTADSSAVIAAYVAEAEAILYRDLTTNRRIGEHGAGWILAHVPASLVDGPPAAASFPDANKISLLTHCNTGSLATSGHGTALGIVRTLHSWRRLRHAFCTETRPYNQGSRLTAFELVYEGIPSTLITDSMAGALFAVRGESDAVAAVVVGADRVVRNGDTANKVGTYALAVLARHHGVRFVVAAPTTSIDLHTESGTGIRIEERKPEELTQITGAVVGDDGTVVEGGNKVRIATADQRIGVWNPAFDVTPHALIDAIVTENGVVEKGADGAFDFGRVMPERWAKDVEGGE